MRQIYCDRCGDLVRDTRLTFKMETGQLRRRLAAVLIDLCGPCAKGLNDYMDSGKPAEVPSLESPPEIGPDEFPM